jgi:hypothetical protein
MGSLPEQKWGYICDSNGEVSLMDHSPAVETGPMAPAAGGGH